MTQTLYARRRGRRWRHWPWNSLTRGRIAGEHHRSGINGYIDHDARNNEEGHNPGDNHTPRPIGTPLIAPSFVGTRRVSAILKMRIWHGGAPSQRIGSWQENADLTSRVPGNETFDVSQRAAVKFVRYMAPAPRWSAV